MRIRFGALFDPFRRWPLPSAVVAFVLLAVTAVAGWFGWRAYVYWRHREAADRALEHYDLDAAHDELTAAVAMDPRNAELRLLAARTCRRAGLLQEAERHLNAYQDIRGQATPEGALERALLAAQGGRLDDVQDHLYSLLDIHHPDSARILEALALGTREVYRLDQTKPLLDEWLRREPGNVQALMARGQLYESVRQMDDALDDYREAVRREPGHDKARLRLAQALLRDKRWDEAEDEFAALRGRRPHDADVLLGLARCLTATGRHNEARPVLDDLLRDHPDDGDALLERGREELGAGTAAAAEPYLRRAVELMPFEREAHYQLGQCLQRLGRADEAAEHDRRMKEIEADSKRLEELYVQTYKEPRNPEPRLEAGRICMKNGQEQEGLRWMVGALQCDPTHRPTRDALADYYERHGDKDAAAQYRKPAARPGQYGGRG
jgi:predicted Zn-dependent protease